MKENPKAFIPAWLNNLKLSQAEFRLYCNLVARADIKTGIAWPQSSTIATDCLMAKNTVWKTLQLLTEKGLIQRLRKPFGASNRYRVLVPSISANEIPIEDEPISANEIPIGTVTNERKLEPSIGANESHQLAQMDSREGITNKDYQLKTTKSKKPLAKNVTSEGLEFANWFRSLLPNDHKMTKNWQINFAKHYDDLIRIDKRTDSQIRTLCQWARKDSFWKTIFYNPSKLRTRNDQDVLGWDQLSDKMKPSNNPSSQINLGRRSS